MARTLKDAKLGTRQARRDSLKPRGKPYWREIDPGLHLGYRRLRGGAGTWCVRRYLGKRQYKIEALGTADDLSDADGASILNFGQAQEAARKSREERGTGPYTVAQAMDDYLKYLDQRGKSFNDAKYGSDALIIPKLGHVEVADLTPDMLRGWLAALAKTPPRVRTKAGEKQQYREIADDDEAQRRRRASANRLLATLKAALNHAFADERVPSNKAWFKIKPYEGVNLARSRFLSIAECKRLINACDPDFRLLVTAALQTGARYGELATRLKVADYSPDAGTLAIWKSKSSKSRQIILTDEGQAFFAQLAAGRPGSELMLGRTWNKSQQDTPMAEAVERAKISPRISFHGLRHTWASHAVMNRVPLLVVARNLGHADITMVQKHYGHLSPSYEAEAIRAGAPRFGFKPDKKIATLGA